jgi:lipopolysaccharide assembly outer membrane protein LptD (OstA)
MQRLRLLILAIAVLALGAGAAYWATLWWNYYHPLPVQQAANHAQSAPPQPGASRPREEITIQSPSMKRTERGRLAWQVQLSEMRIAAGGAAVAAVGMREALIYDQKGVPVIRLTAQTARGNTSDQNLEVSGNVRAVSQRGALITTEQVQWRQKERRLLCPQKVTLRTAKAAVTTRGLSYYVDADIVKAPNVVRMYSGANKLIGRDLVYNVKTQAFEMRNVQAVFSPEQARQLTAPAGQQP